LGAVSISMAGRSGAVMMNAQGSMNVEF